MLDAKVCRTCHKTIDRKDGGCSKLDEVDPGAEITLRTKLHVCVPEMMLGDSNEDVICMICNNMLNLSYMFRNICIKTEQTRHNNTVIPEFRKKIKKETVPDDTGIIVTRLQNPPVKSDKNNSPSTRNRKRSPAAATATTRSEEPSKKQKSGEPVTREKKRRHRTGKATRTNKDVNSHSNVVGVEDMMNGGLGDDTVADGNNQEPLLEIAYEESVADSDIDRYSTASEYSIGSLRDIPEVIVRDPNTNIPPGGRTLRTRQNVSYVMPDSPETVQKHSKSATSTSAQSTTGNGKSANGGEKTTSLGSAGEAGTANSSLGKVSEGGSRGRKSAAATGSGGRSKGAGTSATASTKKESGNRAKLQANISLDDVDVIDDFCRRNNRDPLEFLCSIPILKCDTDIGSHPPPRGFMPVIDNNQCDLCGQQLSRFAGLRRHRWRHFCNYTFCCVICGRTAYERYEMREHLEQRHKLKPDLINKYIENSRLKLPPSKPMYRLLSKYKQHDPSCKRSRNRSNFTPKKKGKPQHQQPQQEELPLRNKPGPKSSKIQQPQQITTTYNKPGPKSSKTISQPVVNKPGPKSSKAKTKPDAAPTNKRTPRTPQKVPNNNAKEDGGVTVHVELKRRRLSIGSTPVVSAKRKRVSPSANIGARFKFECVFCNVLVSDKDTLRVHLKSYHCNICFKFFVGKSTRNAHHCLHVPQKVEDENYYLCLDCDDYKSKVHFLSHLEPYQTRKLDQLFTIHPRPTFDSHSVEEKRRLLPTIKCNLGKINQDCFFFCGDPDALKFHQVRVHGLTKLLQHISTDKLTSFEQLEKQIRPVKPNNTPSLSACLQDMQMINYVEGFVDVEALDIPDTDVDPMAAVGIERCATCEEEMPNGPLEHECTNTNVVGDELYKCEICLNSFDRLSLIEHMKVHMNLPSI